MTQMENRIVLCRFKDGYGPVGAYFYILKHILKTLMEKTMKRNGTITLKS